MNLTQQQIAQLLPFDKEKALKFPEFVYWKDGVKANGTCIGMIEDTKYTADHNYWYRSMRSGWMKCTVMNMG